MSSSIFPRQYLQLAWQVLDFCQKNNYKITVAESCTGGLLSALLTEIAGSSAVFEMGFVSYANNFKQQIFNVYDIQRCSVLQLLHVRDVSCTAQRRRYFGSSSTNE